MGIFRSMSGLIRVECTSADVAGMMEQIGKENIPVFYISSLDDVTIRFTVYRKDHPRLKSILSHRGEVMKTISRGGIFWPLQAMLSRPVLLSGVLLVLLMGIYLPGRIMFVSVEGNSAVAQRLILEAAEECGLHFWASRRDVRSEQIKNYLLDTIPQLKWAGVNTYGCRAVITVRERDEPPIEDELHSVRHIVAARDGVITSCTVTDGCGMCSVGQAVQEGDILISGYTDCGLTIRAGIASGTVMAATDRQLTVKTPGDQRVRSDFSKETVRFSLVIGKKRINFYKGSGISGSSCVKMYSEYVLTLPGDFSLPVKLLKETVTDCQLHDEGIGDPAPLLESFSKAYLQQLMKDGSVIQRMETVSETDGVFILTGRYACVENICREQDEKIGEFNGKTDRTDRERGSGG